MMRKDLLRLCERAACVTFLAEKKSKKIARVLFVSQGDMKAYNRTYRAINKPTDVLSFTSGERGEYAGEIVICPACVQINATAQRVSFKEELVRVSVHGALHLLGYDHARAAQKKKMFSRQERYIKKIMQTEKNR